MEIARIGKTVLPAVVVLVAGLFGVNFIYNTYMNNSATSVITLEPAAGEEGVTVSVEDAATSVTTQVGDNAVTTVTETIVEPIDACATADAAAKSAIGTDTEAAAAKAASDCAAAKAVQADAKADVDAATATAVDAAVEGVKADAVVAPAAAPVEAAPADKAAE